MIKPLIFHGWKPVHYKKIIEHILNGVETNEKPLVDNCILQSVTRFMDRWRLNPETTKLGIADVEKVITRTITDNANKSLENHKAYAAAEAIRITLIENGVTPTVLVRKNRLTIVIAVSTVAMMRLWRSTVPIEKFTVWDETLTVSDIKTVDHLLDIIDAFNKLYNLPPLRKRYETYMASFKPHTGEWTKLYKLAAKINRLCLEKNNPAEIPEPHLCQAHSSRLEAPCESSTGNIEENDGRSTSLAKPRDKKLLSPERS